MATGTGFGTLFRRQPAEWLAAGAWLVVSIGTLVMAAPLPMYGGSGPGAGFGAKWLASILLLLGLVRIVLLWRSGTAAVAAEAPEADAGPSDLGRFVLVFVALFAFALVLDRVGFTIATAALVWAVLTILQRHPLRALIEAAVAAIALDYAFGNLLGVFLPGPSLF
jgi:hypothetical protein